LEETQTADSAIGLCAVGSPCDNFKQKKHHHEWCGDLQKETTTQSGKQKTNEPANGSFYRRTSKTRLSRGWRLV